MIDFAACKDIYHFYLKAGMNRQEAIVFLLKELNKIKNGEKEVFKNVKSNRNQTRQCDL